MKTGIELVCGPPGAGKGLWLIQKVAEVLLESDQVIVTNFAIKMEELSLWLHKHHPNSGVDVTSRVWFLANDQLKNFYLYRGFGNNPAAVSKQDEQNGKFVDYGPAGSWPSVCYVLDEADLFFGAREWAQHGLSVNFYNKQHRKLGDRVIFCCQDMGQLDANIRRLAQETVVLKNIGKLKLSMLKLPKVYVWKSYYRVPQRSDPVLETGTFRMPIRGGLEDCFETQTGVGLAGSGSADKNQVRKGWAVYWLAVPILLALVIVTQFTDVFGKKVAEKFSGAEKRLPRPEPVARPEPPARPEPAARPIPSARLAQSEAVKVERVYLTGIVVRGGRIVVYLSDGTERENPSSFDRRWACWGNECFTNR